MLNEVELKDAIERFRKRKFEDENRLGERLPNALRLLGYYYRYRSRQQQRSEGKSWLSRLGLAI
jgi:hypothetical protein